MVSQSDENQIVHAHHIQLKFDISTDPAMRFIGRGVPMMLRISV
jgi:hypothetical protein